jgi:phosphonopyruvate decarboxylase
MKAETFVSKLSQININNYFGVPDSLMSSLSKYLAINENSKVNHKILHNEGGAVGMAIGKYASNREISAVYMQNSGFGNIINPITSLTNKDVFSIPILYIIGWRGSLDIKDEPQHKMQGRITLDLLKLLDINFLILDSDEDLDLKLIEDNLSNQKSFALVVKKDFFEKNPTEFPMNQNKLLRQDVMQKLYKTYTEDTLFVSTTGKTSRELYEISKNDNFRKSFFTVGGMGHSSAIALGIAESNQDKQIVCFDGDGSLLMHMGALSIIGVSPITNFHYILLNNYSHESVGGQPTVANKIRFKEFSYANNFEHYLSIKSEEDFSNYLKNIKGYCGKKMFIEINIKMYSDKNLPRPDLKPSEYISEFNK